MTYDTAIIQIGGKGSLTDKTLRKMAPAVRKILAHSPGAEVMLSIDGYDDDPRELYEIPETRDYLRRYARASGLHDWTGPLFQALDESTKGLLIAADAIDKPHPYRTEKVPLAEYFGDILRGKR